VRKFFEQNKFSKMAFALSLAGFVLFLSLAGANASFHKTIHADAGSADHHCAITLFAKGQVHASVVAPVLAFIALICIGSTALPDAFLLPSADYRYSSSRAPPAFSCLPA
jgi:hypothetical protein